MLLKENFSKEYLQYLLYELYSKKYSDVINSKICEKLNYIVDDGLINYEVPSELHQMYHEYSLIKEELDNYLLFKNKLLGIYSDIGERNIADICAGMVPQLSKELSKVTSGKVVAVDKYLTSNNDSIPNLTNIQGEFNDETTLSNQNLLVALHPCNLTLQIIKKAIEYNIDFAIAICDCYSSSPNTTIRVIDWYNLKNRIMEMVERSNLGKVEFDSMGSYPFVYTNKNRR